MTKRITTLVLAVSALALSGCVTPTSGADGLYAKPIGGAPVTANPTPYSEALVCLSNYAKFYELKTPRVAVGRILDYTGKADAEGGRKVTQGASLMAISAFAKAGAKLVERFDTSVSELELKYANNKLIGEEGGPEADGEFRKIYAGSIPGSDFYLVGGITELNSNIRSLGADASIGAIDPEDPKGRAGLKMFTINVGIDLRLVDTKTLEVVDVISYQKQIIGREISAGIFDFANNNVFDIGAGERALEPIQLAVRSVVERAVLEMTGNLYGVPNSDMCSELMLQADGVNTASIVGNYTPYAPNSTTDGDLRASVDRWSDKRDEGVKSALRGRTEVN